MPAYNNNGYSGTCAQLAQQLQDLQLRIRVSEQNAKLATTYDENIEKLTVNIGYCENILDVLKPMLNDIQEYITKRRKESMQNINKALQMAGEIIQDATEGIYFEMDGDEAWLSTPEGLEVDVVEGGGYRQISSTFLRAVIAAANQGILKTLILDEVFALVSPENSTVLSLYLNVICQDAQVISIEQKPQVYSNIDCIAYTFRKIGSFSEATRREIKREEMENGIQAN